MLRFKILTMRKGKRKSQNDKLFRNNPLGQIQMYVNYYDRKIKLESEHKTIGIILCQDKNEAVVKYTLPENEKQIFASKYKTVLPSKKDLKHLIKEVG